MISWYVFYKTRADKAVQFFLFEFVLVGCANAQILEVTIRLNLLVNTFRTNVLSSRVFVLQTQFCSMGVMYINTKHMYIYVLITYGKLRLWFYNQIRIRQCLSQLSLGIFLGGGIVQDELSHLWLLGLKSYGDHQGMISYFSLGAIFPFVYFFQTRSLCNCCVYQQSIIIYMYMWLEFDYVFRVCQLVGRISNYGFVDCKVYFVWIYISLQCIC
eukprot:TRINITY_DN2444_c0_g1_i7.p4 TRINITY_DN2444_c0_g1~~TRINITY_DN2444_c0_g1_i7.p4  ORF type:complete len:214 (-),score=-6.64 TRINITY_DN2444_c0_g1_i7:509-1150(-)